MDTFKHRPIFLPSQVRFMAPCHNTRRKNNSHKAIVHIGAGMQLCVNTHASISTVAVTPSNLMHSVGLERYVKNLPDC
jgi:hypothetical protein